MPQFLLQNSSRSAHRFSPSDIRHNNCDEPSVNTSNMLLHESINLGHYHRHADRLTLMTIYQNIEQKNKIKLSYFWKRNIVSHDKCQSTKGKYTNYLQSLIGLLAISTHQCIYLNYFLRRNELFIELHIAHIPQQGDYVQRKSGRRSKRILLSWPARNRSAQSSLHTNRLAHQNFSLTIIYETQYQYAFVPFSRIGKYIDHLEDARILSTIINKSGIYKSKGMGALDCRRFLRVMKD